MKYINLVFGGMAVLSGFLLALLHWKDGNTFWFIIGCLGMLWGSLAIHDGKRGD